MTAAGAAEFRTSVGLPVAPDQAAAMLAGGGHPDLVLLWHDPHPAVAAELAAGGRGEIALATWCKTLSQHLALIRGAPAPCLMQKRTEETVPVGPLALAAATLVVARDAEAQRLLSLLRDTKEDPDLALDPLVLLHTALTAETNQEAAALVLAREQLVQLQETLELYYRDAEALRAELNRREARQLVLIRIARKLARRFAHRR